MSCSFLFDSEPNVTYAVSSRNQCDYFNFHHNFENWIEIFNNQSMFYQTEFHLFKEMLYWLSWSIPGHQVWTVLSLATLRFVN